MKRLLVFFSVCFLFAACSSDKTDPDETTMRDVKKEADEFAKAAKNFTLQEKREYEEKIRQEIGKMEERLARLNEQADDVQSQSQEQVDRQIRQLEEDIQDLRTKYNKLKQASSEAWGEMKRGVDEAIKELKERFENTKSAFK